MNTDFFDNIRDIEREQIKTKASNQKPLSLVGTDALPEGESIRFKSHPSLAFPAASSATSELQTDREVVITNFLHLAGSEGVLPLHYSKMVIERLKKKDSAMADFFDMFHHRLTSLLYRSWSKYRLVPQYEAHRMQQKPDPVSKLIDALSGNLSKPSNITRYYSGHFSKKSRSAAGLSAILTDFTGHPVTISQFVGCWINVPDTSLTRITSKQTMNNRLGTGVFIGRRSWNAQSKIEIHIKNLDNQNYQRIMAGSKIFEQMTELIKGYTPNHISVNILFHIDKQSNKTSFASRPQLSRTMWLTTKKEQPLIAKTALN